MLTFIIVCNVALLASAMTFFSGFGLGTILTPALVVFFPAEIAVAMTAIVHFCNNLFKLWLVGRRANGGVVVRFGAPAFFAALVGAWALVQLAGLPEITRYRAAGREFVIEPIKVVIAALMVVFVAWEVLPGLQKLTLDGRWLPLGGVLSGFFGGLSGHQGAFRSVFLLRTGLEKEAFIATGIVIACVIDVSRLGMYSHSLARVEWAQHGGLIAAATGSALAGALIGRALLPSVTLGGVRGIVVTLMLLIAGLLGFGVI